MKSRAIAVLRVAGVLLGLAASFQVSVPRAAHATSPTCTADWFCSPCGDGEAQRCVILTCNGVTGNTVCGACVKHCTPEP